MVGFDEIILIAVAALILFGPDKLPHYLRELGRFYAEIKKAQRELERELSTDVLTSGPAARAPSPQVVEIAKKMGIAAEGKSEEQLLAEIEANVPQNLKADDGIK